MPGDASLFGPFPQFGRQHRGAYGDPGASLQQQGASADRGVATTHHQHMTVAKIGEKRVKRHGASERDLWTVTLTLLGSDGKWLLRRKIWLFGIGFAVQKQGLIDV
ncbi:hypothetical protein GCM10007898_10910 [Dyella flagellata]|uniref:Uncharacterized protein n=1 Tax=Dyella flagellata TaxID=1867833 RepID=A0ABQ5XAF8_9GAMM|nr:hypothetical protein GCM10007898_10910 [Dyella flagellata]